MPAMNESSQLCRRAQSKMECIQPIRRPRMRITRISDAQLTLYHSIFGTVQSQSIKLKRNENEFIEGKKNADLKLILF